MKNILISYRNYSGLAIFYICILNLILKVHVFIMIFNKNVLNLHPLLNDLVNNMIVRFDCFLIKQ